MNFFGKERICIDIYEALQNIGFSVNEAKVYVTLVANSPLNGYEIAKKSNITRTMVYDILGRLINKGAVTCVETEQKMYEPIPYKQLLQKMKSEYEENIKSIEEDFDKIASESKTQNYFKNISGFEEMLSQVRELIINAKRELYLSIWEDEANLLCSDIEAAAKRGVRIISFSLESLPYDCGEKYQYGIPKTETSKLFRRRRIVVIADREEIIIGEGSDMIEEISLITKNTMIIELAIDQIILDIIHMKNLRSRGYLGEKIDSVETYDKAVYKLCNDIGIVISKMPLRVDQD